MSRIIGIDLGTSTSEISCLIDGKPVIMPNSLGKAVTPSVVHIAEDGSVLVGEPAAEYLLTRPESTFMEVKRLTGSGTVLNARGKEYSPEDIQAELLKYLVKCAEEYLGEEVRKAVITVPAYFTDVQRRATVRAGELAGIDVARVINEPTAAALDYGIMNMKDCKNILVYDFGGGTFDVTVLELFEGVIDVKASSGDNSLGGKDFDEIIMKKLYNPGNDRRAAMRLKKAAEECKIALSDNEDYQVSLPFLAAGSGGRPISLERTVTRTEFENWIDEKVRATKKPVLSALADAKLSRSDIDMILLVGGSTRVPAVRRLVKEVLGAEPTAAIDPELTVARGAAVQAAILEGILQGDWEIVLTDVCPYTLGIAAMIDTEDGEELVFSPIIPRNVTIPAEMSNIYYPHYKFQTSVNIRAYQGEYADLEKDQFLGEVMLTGIPPARKEADKEAIEVIFSYDMNGILQVRAKIVSTGKEVSVRISAARTEDEDEIDLSKWEEAPGAKRFRPTLRKADKLIRAGVSQAGRLLSLSDQVKEALIREETDMAEELRQRLVEFMEDMDAQP